MFNNAHGGRAMAPSAHGTRRTQRRYLVKEVISEMSWSGTIWAVGCKTRDSADAAFRRRVAKNLIDRDDPGAVMAYDRKTRRIFLWTKEAGNPKTAARWWCR